MKHCTIIIALLALVLNLILALLLLKNGFLCNSIDNLKNPVIITSICKDKINQVDTQKTNNAVTTTKKITGYGYFRASSSTTLYNKYPGYVKKVYFYSNQRVKAGDVILEYDDFDLRKEITSVENSIANTKEELKQSELKLKRIQLDPLPSDYRNASQKTLRAKELMDRARNEWRAFDRLFKSKSVSELDLRSKRQAFLDSQAAYQIALADESKVNCGLSQLYISEATEAVKSIKVKLAGLERTLAILQEQRKYYKIVTPYDGIIQTNSDTIHSWNSAATSAAVIHAPRRGYYLYSYFEEKDIHHLKEGLLGRFYSNDNGKYYNAKCFEITRSRTAVGEKVYHLAKWIVTSPVEKDLRYKGKGLRINGSVIVEVEVKN